MAKDKKPFYKRLWFIMPVGVFVILAVIGAVTPKKATPPTTTTTTTTQAASAIVGFSAIDGKALPGLPSENWPALGEQYPAGTPGFYGANAEQSTNSNDLAYEVDIFRFPNATAEARFYNDDSNVLSYSTPSGSEIAPLGYNTGVSGQSRAFNLIECGGSSSVEPGNTCSGSVSKPFSTGVITVFERGSTVTLITYFNSGNQSASQGELRKNVKVADSVIALLASVGIH